MKKITLSVMTLALSCAVSAQTQIGNSGFETWDTGSDPEPTNWNSFMTASGGFAGFASNQIESSTDVRPGSTGTKSVRIWSRLVPIVSVVANGNVTLGRINMGSTAPTDSENYNKTITGDADFSEAMTDSPDSLVFWVKFNPNGHSGNARMKTTIHDDYEYRDPEDATSPDHIVATAVLNFPSTSNNWVRKSVPFTYSGPATTAAYILVTFTTNETPGGGAGDDELFIDDVELIYNPATSGVENVATNRFAVYPNPVSNELAIQGLNADATYTMFNVAGKSVKSGEIGTTSSTIQTTELKAGVYFIQINEGNYSQRIKFVKK